MNFSKRTQVTAIAMYILLFGGGLFIGYKYSSGSASSPDIFLNPQYAHNADRLDINSLMNAQYQIPIKVGTASMATLSNGTAAVGNYDISLDKSHVAFGDINSDGKIDAVAVIDQSNSSDAPSSELEAVINDHGMPLFSAGLLLGTNTQINNLAIKNGKIILKVTFSSGKTFSANYQLSKDGSSLEQAP